MRKRPGAEVECEGPVADDAAPRSATRAESRGPVAEVTENGTLVAGMEPVSTPESEGLVVEGPADLFPDG